MRKFISLFIAVAMLLAFAPTIAFADDVASVVIDFTKATLEGGGTAKAAAVSIISSSEFVSVAEESSTYAGDNQRTHYKTVEGMKLLTACMAVDTWSNAPWDGTRADSSKARWTIEFSVPNAGWYTIDFVNAVWQSAGDFYVYADGQYAGVLNCYEDTDDGNSDTNDIYSSADTLENAVYLSPDENGKIKMMFALKNQPYDAP